MQPAFRSAGKLPCLAPLQRACLWNIPEAASIGDSREKHWQLHWSIRFLLISSESRMKLPLILSYSPTLLPLIFEPPRETNKRLMFPSHLEQLIPVLKLWSLIHYPKMKLQIFRLKIEPCFRTQCWYLVESKLHQPHKMITTESQITESCINSYEGKLQDNAADRINNILDSDIPRGSIYYLSTKMSI